MGVDKRISELPLVSEVLTTDEFAVNQQGVSKKATAGQVATFVGVGGSPSVATEVLSFALMGG